MSLPSLAFTETSRAATVARRTLLGATAVVIALSIVYAGGLFAGSAPAERHHLYRGIEVNGDYFAYASVFGGFDGDVMAVRYMATRPTHPPDHVAIYRHGDLAALLRGADVAATHEPTPVSRSGGHLVTFPPIPADCPPPTGGCTQESVPIIVWTKGSAWKGTGESSLISYEVVETRTYGSNGFHGDGPILYGFERESEFLVHGSRWVVIASALAGLVAIGAAAAWIVAERRALRSPHAALRLPAPGHGTDSLLATLHLTSLYVDTIRRYFVVSAFVILFLAGATMYVALPPVLARAYGNLVWFGYQPTEVLFVLLVPFVAAVAFVHWGIAYARVRRELARWSDLSRRFEAETARILQQ